jgi:very-short-patch-repair endonuclease
VKQGFTDGWGEGQSEADVLLANEVARHLRKVMTPQEVKLWVQLRALKAQGLHFRRQVPRNGYIVDFACLKARLIIEIDGAQHGGPSHLARDVKRDVDLAGDGFKVLRFWNNEVNENLDGVVETIYHHAMARVET